MVRPSRALASLLACIAGALCTAAPRAETAAAPVGLVTIADGESTVIHEVSKAALAEGVRLSAGDIVATAPQARLLRIEFNDGSALNLGPDTRLMLSPRLGGDRVRAASKVYLLQGWVKTTVPVASPAVDLRDAAGPVVLALQPEGVQAFSESGTAVLQDRRPGGAAVTLKRGEYFARHGEAKGSTASRPAPAFLEQLPRPFLDTLPARAELFKSRAVTPKPLPAPAYAELQPWIDAEPALRRNYTARWMPLLREPEFRKALAADLPRHPEWERVLFPERFKPASAPR